MSGEMAEARGLERAAANIAAWHATSVEALGYASTWWPGAWATNGPIPGLYLNAIVFTVGQSATEQVGRLAAFFAESPSRRRLEVADGTNQLDLAQLGLERGRARACFGRSPGRTSAPPMPGELEIIEVTTEDLLADFEATSVEGFEAQGVPRFAWHAPGVLADPRFLMWLGKVDGRGVGAAMAYAGDDLIGIYGVTVVPDARRHGYGAALTWQAIQTNPRLPAALQPSDMAVEMYRRLGFARIGHFGAWHRSSRP